jgi:hypothetical protein
VTFPEDRAPDDLPGGLPHTPRLDELIRAELIVPIRSSSGESPEPERVPIDGMRHGTDEDGRFLAAFSSPAAFEQLGPPRSDRIVVPAQHFFAMAEKAGERVVVDAGSTERIEVTPELAAYLAAGVDPNAPDALRARSPLGAVSQLDAPDEVPEPFGTQMRIELQSLPQVERAWLLRRGGSWTIGIQQHPEAQLADFDEVRNRLHAIATEQLGSRQQLAVTDLRAPALRERYDSVSAPFYVRRVPKGGFLSRIFGGD